MSHPKVFVLILSYNGKYLLEDSLSSYLENDYVNFKIVVVDNGSVDRTLEYVEKNFPNVEVLRTEKNLGYSEGFNLGLDYAFNQNNANYALITNNDVTVDNRVISELVKVAEKDEKIGFVTGKVYYFDKPNIFQTVGKKEDPMMWNGEHIGINEEDKGQYDEIFERSFIDDVFTLVSKKLYKDTGGYNPLFFLQHEEYDWQARAKELGYKIMYTPYARLWHKVSMTIGKKSPLQAYYYARNQILVIMLHKSTQFFRRFFRHHFYRYIFRSSLQSLKQRRISVAFAKWRGFFSALMWGVKNRKFSIRHFI